MSPALLLAAALAAAPASAPAHKKAPLVPTAEKGRPLDIRADHLTVLTKENRGLWKGHVHAVRPPSGDQPQLDLKCDELVTDYAGEDKLEKVTCKGNVEVTQGDRQGFGELAVFDNDKGELVVTGNPRGKQGPNSFYGDRLVFFPNSDRVEVENPRIRSEQPPQLGGGSENLAPKRSEAAIKAEPAHAEGPR